MPIKLTAPGGVKKPLIFIILEKDGSFNPVFVQMTAYKRLLKLTFKLFEVFSHSNIT